MTAAVTEHGVAVAAFQPTSLYGFVGESLPEPRWAVDGLWPEGASGVIGGRPKDKKSTLAAELAVSLWSGTSMFALPDFAVRSRPAAILYVQQENADERVQRDLQLILAARGLGELRQESHYVGEDNEVAYQAFEYGPERDGYADGLPAFEVLSHAGLDLSARSHQEWLEGYVADHGVGYVFLDPLYQLIGAADEKDSAQLRPVLQFLTRLKNEHKCGVVATHHMTDKGGGNDASSLLGSTYIHAWYEAAIFTRSNDLHFVTLKVDAQRDVGETREYGIQGLGVGTWYSAPLAQGQTDSAGRAAPRVAQKETNLARLRELAAERPAATDEELAMQLGVTGRTVRNYKNELAQRDGG